MLFRITSPASYCIKLIVWSLIGINIFSAWIIIIWDVYNLWFSVCQHFSFFIKFLQDLQILLQIDRLDVVEKKTSCFNFSSISFRVGQMKHGKFGRPPSNILVFPADPSPIFFCWPLPFLFILVPNSIPPSQDLQWIQLGLWGNGRTDSLMAR